MIVITGATGRLGGMVVDGLLDRLPAAEIGVSVRDVDAAAALAARGVRVRHGDFTDPSTLEHAFAGADQVLVVSAAIRGPGAAAANIAALDAARAAGASRVLYTSHQAAAPDSLFAPQRVHAATEAHLSGTFTALRNGFYASTIGFHLGGALETGRLELPQDGPVSWTAHADLAAAAVAALTEPGVLDGITAPLTAPELLNFADVARLLGEITGRRVERVVVDDDAWLAAATGRGMPAAAAEFTLGMFRAARAGEFAVTDPTLEAVLGRPAVRLRSVLEDLLSPGAGSPTPSAARTSP